MPERATRTETPLETISFYYPPLPWSAFQYIIEFSGLPFGNMETEEDSAVSWNTVFNELNSDVVNQFFHSCIDEICGRKRMTFQQFTNSVQWTEKEYEIARKFVTELFKNPELLYLDKERMPQRYLDAPEELQLAIRNCVNVRREQLVDALLREQAISNGTTLLDFDWRLKWVMGSSKLATLKEPLLQLDLIVEDVKSQRILDLELNREELDTLINTLEKIKA